LDVVGVVGVAGVVDVVLSVAGVVGVYVLSFPTKRQNRGGHPDPDSKPNQACRRRSKSSANQKDVIGGSTQSLTNLLFSDQASRSSTLRRSTSCLEAQQ
jgi:hypothetical protein